MQSIQGGAAVATGAVLDLRQLTLNHTMVVTTGAGVTAGAVQLQGSLDGTNFAPLAAAVTVNAANTSFLASASNVPVRHVRAAITTAVTGGTVTANIESK